MLNIPALILSSIIWSLLWLLFVALCLRHFPWAMAHDYPPDMQQAAALPAPTPAQKRRTTLFAAAVFAILFAFAIATTLLAYAGQPASFATLFCHLWLMGMAWTAVDLLLLDWLLICTLGSPLFLLPNTTHCAGRRNFRFHFIGFLKGCLSLPNPAHKKQPLNISGCLFCFVTQQIHPTYPSAAQKTACPYARC